MKKSTLLLTLPCLLHAAEIHVSPQGSDQADGSAKSPLATLQAAKDKAQSYLGKESVNITLHDGIYYLADTLTFTPNDSGTQQYPVIFKAANEGQAILSGGSKLDLQWTEYKDGIYQATTPEGLEIDQLFIDGTSQRMARYPNYDPALKTKPYQGYSADAFAKERAAKWADPTGGYIHAMHVAGWGGYHYQITGKDAEGNVTYEGGWQNNRKMGMHKDHRMVENIFEELDAPGEWFHNQKTNTLYYQPAAGVNLQSASVEVVRLDNLVEFKGAQDSLVQNITFDGITVRHAARTFMDNKEQLVRSDWTINRSGAFMLTGTQNISILNSEFDQVGGNAIFVNNYNRGTVVKGCHIHHTGASGVCFVGDPNALRDPLFEYGESNDLSKIDLTKGPKTENFPMDCEVADCLITNIGTVERQPAGVQIAMCAKISVRDCSIYDCARAGINIGDGAFGGHLIERVDVFNTVLETHDHGSFNSWGRDRYWRRDHLTTVQEAVDKNPELPFLDAIHTTTIRDSRWRCDHGWDIDLDDGSTNYDIYNNLMLGKGLKLREGYRRHAWNNVSPFGRLHPHVWFQGSKDQVYNNIFALTHGPARMFDPYVRETMVDKNLFTHDQYAVSRAADLGWDKNSLTGDAMYVDAANGDFRVKEGSLALKLGFKNFPMDQFGVKKPSLKSIARTPEIPTLQAAVAGAKPAPPKQHRWIGAVFQELQGEEFSSYGVSAEAPGLAVVRVAPNSVAAEIGLQVGDVMLGLNGENLSRTHKLHYYVNDLRRSRDEKATIQFVRNQKAGEYTVALALLNKK